MLHLQATPAAWNVRLPPLRSAAQLPSLRQHSLQQTSSVQVLDVLVHATHTHPPGVDNPDQTLARQRCEDWGDLSAAARNWNPWGTAIVDQTQTPGARSDEGLTGPPTFANHRVLQRWKLRDKCLCVATYYRVMHLNRRAQRAADLKRLRARFSRWAFSFIRHTQHATRQDAHDRHAAELRASRQGRVSASTRMRMHNLDLYRESRRNAPRRPHTHGDGPRTHRKRLPAQADSEIGSLLYDNMCIVASRFQLWLTRDPG